jgi:2',3'-cyclic-nucleotide 2'-phosphodiesterase/3'-nucleotidase
MDGAGLKAWLEKSAERFNRIDPASSAPQELVNTASRLQLRHADQRRRALPDRCDQPAGQRIVACTIKGGAVAGAGIPGRDQ